MAAVDDSWGDWRNWGTWGDISFKWNSENPFLWLLFCMAFMLVILLIAWIGSRAPRRVKSPYSNMPMRTVDDLSYEAIGKMYLFLTDLMEYDNRMFSLSDLLICRETGRIFPNAKTWWGRPQLDWSFISKRHPGNYVSWGSLTHGQKESVIAAHGSLEGFQTSFSSPSPAPAAAERPYILEKPGPLYVDLETYILVGWKILPGTDLELLIVQKPKERHVLGASHPDFNPLNPPER